MRKLNVGMVAKVMGNVRNDIPVILEIVEELEGKIESAYFEKAPFKTVEVIIEYSDKEIVLSHIGRIVKKEILPVTTELKMSELLTLSRNELYRKFKLTLLQVLLSIGKKYNLSVDSLEMEIVSMQT
jgi:hypothetical protein